MSNPGFDIFTDGACAGNPGPGGWAAVIMDGGTVREISGREERTTNQRMELRAAVEALRRVPPGSRVKLHSDSAYLVNCFKQGWMDRWQLSGWLSSKGEPVENRDLWQQLLELSSERSIEWVKVKGHGTNRHNRRADKLAREAIGTGGTVGKENGDKFSDTKKKPSGGSMNESGPARRIGLLTAGGDCPGLNAVIRAVVKSAIYNLGLEVVGFNNGFKGLVENDARLLGDLEVSGILNRGGTILGASNRDNPFDYRSEGSDFQQTGADRSADAVENLGNWNIECLVVVGGDGSMFLAHRFSEMGVPVIGIPKTIDNDLPATDVTFGFNSAVTTATEAIDKIHTTAESHHRVMVIEVMGRNAGWIALQAGMAGGGDIILIPELPFNYSCINEKIMERLRRGKKFSIMVVSEGAYPEGGEQLYWQKGNLKRLGGIGEQVSREIEKRTGMESRATVLGHVQRGGSPTSYDRVLATRFGCRAVELFVAGRYNEMVCLKGYNIESVPLKEVVERNKRVDPASEQVRAALAVGTSFGCPLSYA